MSSSTPDGVFCLSKDCPPSVDWLTHMPSSTVGWAVGGAMMALSIVALSWEIFSKTRVRFLVYKLSLLAVSLFLRAGMSLEAGNKAAMYKASLYFNYFAAIHIGAELMTPSFKFKCQKMGTKWSFALKYFVSTSYIHPIMLILMIAAVSVMFNPSYYINGDPPLFTPTWKPRTYLAHLHIIRLVLAFLIIMALVTIIIEVAVFRKLERAQKYLFAGSILQNTLLTMWALFMAIRTNLPLDDPARDIESVFYGLNIAPLFVIGILPRCMPTEDDLDD